MNFGQTFRVYLDEESDGFTRAVALLHALLCKDFNERERRDFMYLFDTTIVIMDDVFPREDHWIRYVEMEVEKLIAYNVLLRKRVRDHKLMNKFWRSQVKERNDGWDLLENQRKELAAEVFTHRDVSNVEKVKSDIKSWCIRCNASDEEMDEFLYSSILGVEEEEEKEMKESYGKKMNTIDTLKVIRIPKDDDAFTWTFAVLRALLSSDFSKQVKGEVIRILDEQHVDIPKTKDRWIRYVEMEVGKLIAYQISADREDKRWKIRSRILGSMTKYWFDRDMLSNNRVTSYSQLRRPNGVLDSTFWESECKYWLERCILTEKRLQEIWTSGLFQREDEVMIWKFKLNEPPNPVERTPAPPKPREVDNRMSRELLRRSNIDAKTAYKPRPVEDTPVVLTGVYSASPTKRSPIVSTDISRIVVRSRSDPDDDFMKRKDPNEIKYF